MNGGECVDIGESAEQSLVEDQGHQQENVRNVQGHGLLEEEESVEQLQQCQQRNEPSADGEQFDGGAAEEHADLKNSNVGHFGDAFSVEVNKLSRMPSF